MRILAAGLLALFLAACGFQPMYHQAGGQAAIGPVQVRTINGRAGHVLKTELDRIFAAEAGAGGTPLLLDINLDENVSRLGLRRDESSSRAELKLTANYVLYPAQGEPLRGSIYTTVNYEVPLQAFGEITAQDDARERAAETLAERFRSELAIRLAQARSAQH
jgi:LPS-assembly lipoprotein